MIAPGSLVDRDRIALRSHPENILLLSWGGGTASFGAAARVPEFPCPPLPNVEHHSLPTDSVGKELLLNI